MRKVGRAADRVAIVTGAGRAIGRACAILLSKEGACIIAADADGRSGQETVSMIQDAGGTAEFFCHRVEQENDWRRLVDTALNLYQRLDILAHTTHLHFVRSLEDMSLSEFRATEHTNIQGPWLGLRHAGVAARRHGHGSMVVVTSALGLAGREDTAAPSMSAAAVRIMIRSAALEFAAGDPKVRVNAVLVDPAYFDLPLDSAAPENMVPERDPNATLSPFDVAYSILYLATESARFMTGAELVLDHIHRGQTHAATTGPTLGAP